MLSILVLLCKGAVPVLLGLSRALGRASSGDPLFLRIFPEPIIPSPVAPESQQSQINKKRSFPNFRSIIPRSLSSNLPIHSDVASVVSVDSDRDNR